MPVVTVEEWQLLSFFEVEPTLRDSDVPWCYNDALYCVVQGDISMSFAIAPAYHDVRLILRHKDEVVYELTTTGVRDVKYHRNNGCEQLTIEIDELDAVELHLKPRIEIRHCVERRT
jgi:hypothetical protein